MSVKRNNYKKNLGKGKRKFNFFSKLFKGLSNFIKNDKTHKVTGLFLITLSVFLLIAFTSYLYTWKFDDVMDASGKASNLMGKLGFLISFYIIKNGFGIASYLFVLLSFITGFKLFFNIKLLDVCKTYKYSFFTLIWLPAALYYLFYNEKYQMLSGIFGYEVNIWMENIFGKIGTGLLLIFILISFLIITFNIHKLFKKKDAHIQNSNDFTTNFDKANNETIIEPNLNEDTDNKDTENTDNQDTENTDITDESNIQITIENKKDDTDGKTELEHKTIDTEYDPTLDLPHYKFPTLDLLKDYGKDSININKEELEENKNKIVKTLNNYGIEIDKIKATIGPTVTLYEIIPAPGIRISKIKNLEDDIALSLSALGIRIIAPIPGKGTIGIEIPNRNKETVSIKSILFSSNFQNSKFDLPIGLGKTISNECFVYDLTKMPHLLIAGATGQGKSVGLNTIITSLLYKKHPSQLKFVLIDPKRVELTLFSKIERHFLAKLPDSEEAIITDTRKVVRTLNSLCIEMEQRYNLLKDAQARNIKEYNIKFIKRGLNPDKGHHFLPYIVLIIDEFADLMMTVGKEIEMPIARLAQLARATGIHLIITTQRPSVNIITGTIKANFPARMAFRVMSKIDSRTILDLNGADQLIGRGDMLLSINNKLVRLQCAFVDTPEVEQITSFIGSQKGYTNAFLLPEYNEEKDEKNNNTDTSDRDEMFEEAARIIVLHQHGSTSLLQRKLKIGYNRAGRIIDQLEDAGIIGHFEGSKAREVRIKDQITLEQLLKDNK